MAWPYLYTLYSLPAVEKIQICQIFWAFHTIKPYGVQYKEMEKRCVADFALQPLKDRNQACGRGLEAILVLLLHVLKWI